MSTFKGLFAEIPGIAVDQFEGECLKSKFLFLSHCHADHMVGLASLESLSIPLFTTAISAVFLQKQFPNIASAIEIIETEIPLDLAYRLDDKDVHLIVTALSAKHCPGSVMFLFETNTHTLLYTGDFRILKSHFKQYEMLKTKKINALHLDSTFLSKRFNDFPTQIESIQKICTLISEWLEMHPENKVLIEMPAQYGIEFLFMGIEKKLGQKIHVTEAQWQKYVYLPAMDNCISPDASKCRIFTKFKCNFGPKAIITNRYRVIKPSAMFWANWQRGKPFVVQVGERNEYRVAYSNHSSCSELKDFLEFTKPERVSLNVVPDKCEISYMETLKRIYPTVQPETKDISKEEDISFENIFLLTNPNINVSGGSPGAKLPPKRLKL